MWELLGWMASNEYIWLEGVYSPTDCNSQCSFNFVWNIQSVTKPVLSFCLFMHSLIIYDMYICFCRCFFFSQITSFGFCWLSLSFLFSIFSSVQFSRLVVSDSLQPHGLQHARPPCLSPTPDKLMSIELVMPSNHLILCHPLLFPTLVFPSIKVFSNGLVLRIRWPKYWSFSFNISPDNTQDWSLGWTGWISLQSKGLSRVFNITVQKHQYFYAQLSL